MYNEFFGFTKKPFSLAPDPEFLYLSPKHKKALTVLRYGLMSQVGFTVITGDIGAGKTTLIRKILKDISQDCLVGLITNTHSAFGDLLTWVLGAFNIPDDAQDKAQRYKIFVNFLQQQTQRQKRVVLIVDEAQNMDLQTLEELRLLSNVNVGEEMLLQLILAGQPELVEKLNQPELTQFAQRISVEYHLTPLNCFETEQYIQHRLTLAGAKNVIFGKSVCATIFYYSGGVPRLINNLCDLALVYTFAEEEKEVKLQTILEVVKERKMGGIISIQQNKSEEAEHIRQILLDKIGVDIGI